MATLDTGITMNIIVMRHGWRIDQCDITNPNLNDHIGPNPQLDPTQYKIIYDAYDHIDHVLYGKKLDAIHVSPYARCVQTALALKTNKKFTINGQLGEVNHPKTIKHPLDTVIPTIKSDLSNMFKLPDATIDDIKFVTKEETRGIGGSADKRYRDQLNLIATNAIKDNHSNVLIITHGDCLGSVVAMCNMSLYSIEFAGIIFAKYNTISGWSIDVEKCYQAGITSADF